MCAKMTDSIHKEITGLFPTVFRQILTKMSELQGVKISEPAMQFMIGVIESVFENNAKRLSSRLEVPLEKLGKSTPKDIAFSLASALSNLIIGSAVFEGRREVLQSDLYMALIDLGKISIWPWTD